jgi:hypothetical protein
MPSDLTSVRKQLSGISDVFPIIDPYMLIFNKKMANALLLRFKGYFKGISGIGR